MQQKKLFQDVTTKPTDKQTNNRPTITLRQNNSSLKKKTGPDSNPVSLASQAYSLPPGWNGRKLFKKIESIMKQGT